MDNIQINYDTKSIVKKIKEIDLMPDDAVGLFIIKDCILIQIYTGKTFTYRVINFISEDVKYLFHRKKEIIKDDSDVRTINNILSYIKEPNENLEEMIQDPNYDFKMKSKDIMDHHYIMEIADFEWKKAQRQKQDKGYMGRMSFPENFDKPSRTVMATMSCSSRESMIYPFIPDEERYRLPTVREIACLMSYPLDYRFYGKSKSIKYKLVGNSVPPKMSFAIAKAIAIAITNNLELPNKYQPIEFDDTKEDFKNLNGDIFHINIEKEKRPTAKFKYHIPYLIVNTFRVELTNKYSNFDNLNFKWNAEIHKSQGKTARTHVPKVDLNIINKDILFLNSRL